MVMTNK